MRTGTSSTLPSSSLSSIAESCSDAPGAGASASASVDAGAGAKPKRARLSETVAPRFAWTWLGDYPGGAWFCDLSAATDEDTTRAAFATGLGVAVEALGRLGVVVNLT